MIGANLFILSSLWEDPGWVLIEAAASNTLVLASNCKNGPEELIEKNQGGVLFKNNSYEDFIEKFKHVTELNHKEIYEKKVNQSKILGTKILDQLKRDPYTKIHKKNVEFADFRVLKSIDIPSVLVESGFITNPEDAERLKGKAGRRMIARSIFLGIHNYFLENPIKGTIVENKPEFLSYTIQKGDVLSEIAIRFGVSVESIDRNNNLNNKPIYPGQILKIYI